MALNAKLKVAALAGRRIDGPSSKFVQFPLTSVPKVTAALRELFEEREFTNLVCSAACGADLVAVESAKLLGMTIDIVLPYSPSKFRKSSVVDRPGNWGPIYDRVIKDSASQDRLHIIASDEEGTYDAATEAILKLAQSMAPPPRVFGVVVWEGRPRDKDDATLDFKLRAENSKMKTYEVATC